MEPGLDEMGLQAFVGILHLMFVEDSNSPVAS
jgi:hypothetical protein